MAIAYGCALAVFPCDLSSMYTHPWYLLVIYISSSKTPWRWGVGLELTLGALAEPQLSHSFKVMLPIQSQSNCLESEISHRDEERVQFCPQLH